MVVIDALVAALRNKGIAVIEQPQSAINTNARLDLWLVGFTMGGELRDNNPLTYETMTFNANIISAGVAKQFVGDLRKILRTMMELGKDSLSVSVTIPDQENPGETKIKKLRANFEKMEDGSFEYETEEAPMPARFTERWRITITYPANIVSQ